MTESSPTLTGRMIEIRTLRQEDLDDAGEAISLPVDADLSDFVVVLVEDLAQGIAAVIDMGSRTLVFQNSDGEGSPIADPEKFLTAVDVIIDMVR